MEDSAAALARIVLGLRGRRALHLPSELFSDHPWGLLLVMFIADADGERLTALDAFRRADVVPAIGRRWMTVLMTAQLVTSEGQCSGNNVVSLSPAGITAIEACMQDASEWMKPIQPAR